ncbi:putative heme exporter protein D [Yersinia frederiksenii]|uniref:Heme exporter protein D n=2 Tax=Yersinia frederiksenii TaxID=29484 RepID=A0A380PS22_YERFR|nr:heme exporter protein CcmD [Yersinia frederiksenii]ATM95044.1 heme exporter protein CcmD [Yersinia frederiksenii]KGA47626.1 heme exporter protein CcmD [Yersinia frederiksenii ATCC 33641]MDN0119920.1 heme exporter protein CcmD [Yersinia frederiksenii]CFR03346.1 putative heme exporter protein D [Yersinia frederiksenii]CNB52327.1 putative heme exporter protein D [Yersinia frederiksenii]
MNPAFNSWAAFFAMGGYAFYVWLAVAVTLLSLLGLWAHTRWQHQQLFADIQRREAREKRIRQANQSQLKQTQSASHPQEKQQ